MKARWLGVGTSHRPVEPHCDELHVHGRQFNKKTMPTGLGNVNTVLVANDSWKVSYQKNVGEQNFVLGLGFNKCLSSEYSKAYGEITVDLTGGEVLLYSHGLPENDGYDVWLVDNQERLEKGVAMDVGDRMIRLNSLAHENNSWERDYD